MQNEEFDFNREKLSQTLLNEYLEEEDALTDNELERRKWQRIRRVLLGVVAVLLLGFFIFAWQTDQLAFTSSDVESLPLVRADNRPVKVKPDDPGGIKIANMDKSIYDSIDNESKTRELPKVTRILPAPETPVRRAEIALTPIKEDGAPPKLSDKNNAEKAEIVADVPITDVNVEAIKPSPEKANQPVEPKEPTIEDVIGEALGESLKEVKASDIKPIPVVKRKPLKVPSRVVVDNGPRIQLGAFRTRSEARAHWQHVASVFAKLMDGKKHYVEKVDLGTKGIFYRLQVGTLKNDAQGRSICNALIEQKQGCFIVK